MRVGAFAAARVLRRTQLDALGRLVGVGGGLQGLEQRRRDVLVGLGAVHGATRGVDDDGRRVSSGEAERRVSWMPCKGAYLTLVSDGQVVTALMSS